MSVFVEQWISYKYTYIHSYLDSFLMEQQTGSKKEKEYVKFVYCHPAYLTYMQNTSWETMGCMKHKLESIQWGPKPSASWPGS